MNQCMQIGTAWKTLSLGHLDTVQYDFSCIDRNIFNNNLKIE